MTMITLYKLIDELCPNGVEYKPLNKISSITRGGNFQKKDYTQSGIPCIHYGQIYTQYDLFVSKTLSYISDEVAEKQKFATTNDIIMAVTSENIEDVCKCVAWLGNDKIAVSGHTAIIHHNQNPKYLTYFFHSNMFFQQKKKIAHGTKVMEVTPDKLGNICIPLPPLHVQAEIVRILDNFTELTAELTARKKQYEYYRNELLSFNDTVNYKTLGEICYLSAGGDVPKSNFSKTYNDNFQIPIYSNGIGDNALYGYTNIAKINERCVTIAARGTIGYCALRKTPFFPIIRLICAIPKNEIIADYLKYVIETIKFQVPTSGIPQLTVPMVAKYKIPVPPLKEQERIVSILDRFNKLCNDISDGLPSEIAARQKQYEYYRDKLLSFKEKT